MSGRIIDVNGQKYRVTTDDHGWVRIEPGEKAQAETDDEQEFYPYDISADTPMGMAPHTLAFHPEDDVPALVEALQEAADQAKQ